MSEMNVDDFDTYVSLKGFKFVKEVKQNFRTGILYALKPNKSANLRAEKFITLYSSYQNFRFDLTYQTSNNLEYVKLKNQLRPLGYIMSNTEVFTNDDGESANLFVYKKGKKSFVIFASLNSYEISFTEKVN